MVLHTWSSDLGLHPHWHALVTAGGLSLDGERWLETRRTFLFPVAAIAKMYRGRMLQGLIEAFHASALDLGEIDDLDRTLRLVAKRHCKWGVHVEAPGDRPVSHALKYLARYIYRGPISNGRMVGVTDTHVSFRARDVDGDGKQRVLWLEGPEFVRRFLLHVLPKGLRKVRHYGLYSPGGAARLLESARTLLPQRPDADGSPSDLEIEAILSRVERQLSEHDQQRKACPRCGARMSTEPVPRPVAVARGPP